MGMDSLLRSHAMGSIMSTNWKALQAFGCLKPEFAPPKDVNLTGMIGGCWKANLHKEGVKHIPSRGGGRKHGGKTTLRIGPYYKDAIFSPVLRKLTPTDSNAI